MRGLDYYRHTAFEFVTDQLGAQGTVIAGGRYDGLIESLGGPHTPAVGWAAGVERLAMMIDAPNDGHSLLAVVPDRPELEAESYALAAILRQAGFAVEFPLKGNCKRRIEHARKQGASAVILLRSGETFPRLHLTDYLGDTEKGRLLAHKIQEAVSGRYEGISGRHSE